MLLSTSLVLLTTSIHILSTVVNCSVWSTGSSRCFLAQPSAVLFPERACNQKWLVEYLDADNSRMKYINNRNALFLLNWLREFAHHILIRFNHRKIVHLIPSKVFNRYKHVQCPFKVLRSTSHSEAVDCRWERHLNRLDAVIRTKQPEFVWGFRVQTTGAVLDMRRWWAPVRKTLKCVVSNSVSI